MFVYIIGYLDEEDSNYLSFDLSPLGYDKEGKLCLAE